MPVSSHKLCERVFYLLSLCSFTFTWCMFVTSWTHIYFLLLFGPLVWLSALGSRLVRLMVTLALAVGHRRSDDIDEVVIAELEYTKKRNFAGIKTTWYFRGDVTCNLMFHLTTKYVFEKFWRAIARFPIGCHQWRNWRFVPGEKNLTEGAHHRP